MDCLGTSAGKSSQPALEFFIDITVCLTSVNVPGRSTMLLLQLLIYDIGLMVLTIRYFDRSEPTEINKLLKQFAISKLSVIQLLLTCNFTFA